MGHQSYLLRKGARYHFRRRLGLGCLSTNPISVALGTSDPARAKRLARRLAAKWDELEMSFQSRIKRGTLTLEEADTFFREGLKSELVFATADLVNPEAGRLPEIDTKHHATMAAAYRIAGRVPRGTEQVPMDVIEAEISKQGWQKDWWTRQLSTLRFVMQNELSPSEYSEFLAELGAPDNDGTQRDARAHHLRGKAEAHDRTMLFEQPEIQADGRGVISLLDDKLVAAARYPKQDVQKAPVETPPAPEGLFATNSRRRFSEIIEEAIEYLAEDRGWKEGLEQRRAIAERFAWLTGDKALGDYTEADIQDFLHKLRQIPKTVSFGRLYASGLMAKPFEEAEIPAVDHRTKRSTRTINRDLSQLQAISKYLSAGPWKSRHGKVIEMDFASHARKVAIKPDQPQRMPWTPDHLKAMFSLGVWQGGGSNGARLCSVSYPKIYQDAAYWVPLIAAYTGLAREEICGLEVEDFSFSDETPWLVVRENMSRSKDGKTPQGLKRPARGRLMPLHPELLRLGLAEYVSAIAKERADGVTAENSIFPELYDPNAKVQQRSVKNPKRGGLVFWTNSWRYIADATHALLPLPVTVDGKRADLHSMRTFNQSVLASGLVSQSMLDRHMGHAQTGTGARSYNRRALAIGADAELRERLEIVVREMPNVTEHIPKAPKLILLPLNYRSRVGSAPGRSAKYRLFKD